MNGNLQHNPLPWRMNDVGDIVDANGKLVAIMPLFTDNEGNAKLIITLVNSLVEDLEEQL